MTNITLSIDDKIYKKMKLFSDIRWSEFVRRAIELRITELEKLNSKVFCDETLLGENWLSEEDDLAWKDL